MNLYFSCQDGSVFKVQKIRRISCPPPERNTKWTLCDWNIKETAEDVELVDKKIWIWKIIERIETDVFEDFVLHAKRNVRVSKRVDANRGKEQGEIERVDGVSGVA